MHLFSLDGKHITYKEMVMTNDDYPSNMSKHCLLYTSILKRNDLSVTKSLTQLTIGNLFGRSVRLDIYANDATGKQHDIEVQQDDSGTVPERARLNSALFDSRLTTSGRCV